ncbi:MAG TPA: sugar phosphate isomerase/epimerase family protein [bacterium]|nr:sugar phosphate isomerase/epimerase family protein [bacterium]
MRLGVSSFAAIGAPLREVARDLLAFDVDVEIMCEPPHAWPAPVPWEHGRVASLHSPILGINTASTNPGIREESVRQVLTTIDEAARLGAEGVVVHPGIPPYQEVFPRDRGLPYAIESLRRCAERAAAAGVEVYLENMPAITLAEGTRPVAIAYAVTYEELRMLFDAVNHPALRLCLDLGHAHLAGRHVLDAMLKDRDVVHVHVNDNLGRRDDHLAWGEGEISKIVDLGRDLLPSVRSVIVEVKNLEACAKSLARVPARLAQRRT